MSDTYIDLFESKRKAASKAKGLDLFDKVRNWNFGESDYCTEKYYQLLTEEVDLLRCNRLPAQS